MSEPTRLPTDPIASRYLVAHVDREDPNWLVLVEVEVIHGRKHSNTISIHKKEIERLYRKHCKPSGTAVAETEKGI